MVPLFQLGDVLCRLGQDGGLVEFCGMGETGETIVTELRLIAVVVYAGMIHALGNEPQAWDGVAELGDLVVEVGAVSLLDHVVSRLLGSGGGAATGCYRCNGGGCRRGGGAFRCRQWLVINCRGG